MRFSRTRLFSRTLLLTLATLCLAGCIRVDTGSKMPTMGEQLIDLTRAKQMGQLTEEEFERLRRGVLASF